MFTHATAVPKVPVLSQTCTPLPEHCFAPGVHVPVHAPDTQVALLRVLFKTYPKRSILGATLMITQSFL